MLSYKQGVRFGPILSPIHCFINVAAEVYSEFGYDTVVTSINDGKHSPNSLHWVGHAADLRTAVAGITPDIAEEIVQVIMERLPVAEFDVIVEHDHIHGEFQPER